jgi:hypothetical protein
MNIDTQIARVKELIAKREEIDAELASMLGVELKSKKAQRCSLCNGEGHSARTCPQKPGDKIDGASGSPQ